MKARRLMPARAPRLRAQAAHGADRRSPSSSASPIVVAPRLHRHDRRVVQPTSSSREPGRRRRPSPPPKQADFGSDQTVPADRRSLLDKVQAVDGVDAAEGGVFQQVTISEQEGRHASSADGAPTFIVSTATRRFDALRLRRGRARRGPPTRSRSTVDRRRRGLQGRRQGHGRRRCAGAKHVHGLRRRDARRRESLRRRARSRSRRCPRRSG